MVSLYMPIVKFILALKLEFSKPQLRHLFTLVQGTSAPLRCKVKAYRLLLSWKDDHTASSKP
ncbi:hypothetical protein QJ48_21165 [Paenibacillus sp. A3]|nr:hypothetical protein QJ48_21165 [Paenibacillus sp. A3]